MAIHSIDCSDRNGKTHVAHTQVALRTGDKVAFNNRSRTGRLTVSRITDARGNGSPLGQNRQPVSQVTVPFGGTVMLDVLRKTPFSFKARIDGALPDGPIIIIDR